MAASEVPDTMSQTPEHATEKGTCGSEEWPSDLEVCIEFCTRSAFHARYDPDKYLAYYQMVGDAFRVRSAQTKIVGNPFVGRYKLATPNEQFGQEADLPRLGAFEVSVNSEKFAGGRQAIFSKLESRRWPNPRVLILQVERLLRGEPLLQPLPPPLDENGLQIQSPRRTLPRPNKDGSYGSPRSPASTWSSASPPRAPPAPSSATTSPSKPKKPGRKEASATQETRPATGDSKGASKGALSASEPHTAEQLPATGLEEPYEAEFEGEDSADNSSGCGPKVWMPGAARQEKWEEEEASENAGNQNETVAQEPKPGNAPE